MSMMLCGSKSGNKKCQKDIVSIIIPVYNVESYLDNCLQSVINQTYHNLEIICINDNSSDNSLKLLKKYEFIDNRIFIINSSVNEGLSASRNKGLDVHKGEYVFFLDSDDYLLEDAIEKLITIIHEKNADMVYGQKTYVGNNQIQTGDINVLSAEEVIISEYKSHFNYGVGVTGRLYKSVLFDGLRFKLNKIHEDEFIWHELIMKCKSIVLFDYTVYMINVREDSLTSKKTSTKRRLDVLDAIDNRANFFKCYGNKYIYTLVLSGQVDRIIENYYLIEFMNVNDYERKKLKRNLIDRIKKVPYKDLLMVNRIKKIVFLLIPEYYQTIKEKYKNYC